MKYVAFLRGIGPSNPNMHQAKLVGVLEKLGFQNVQAVISSGNVLFESQSTDVKKLEETIEEAWPKELGFTSTTIIRSIEELEDLVAKTPFKEAQHTPKTNLNVTFLKNKPTTAVELPENQGYKIVASYDREICSVIDLTSARTPDLMLQIEKRVGKEITTRTWATVNRILKKLQIQKFQGFIH